jgi:hypothetical protein
MPAVSLRERREATETAPVNNTRMGAILLHWRPGRLDNLGFFMGAIGVQGAGQDESDVPPIAADLDQVLGRQADPRG